MGRQNAIADMNYFDLALPSEDNPGVLPYDRPEILRDQPADLLGNRIHDDTPPIEVLMDGAMGGGRHDFAPDGPIDWTQMGEKPFRSPEEMDMYYYFQYPHLFGATPIIARQHLAWNDESVMAKVRTKVSAKAMRAFLREKDGLPVFVGMRSDTMMFKGQHSREFRRQCNWYKKRCEGAQPKYKEHRRRHVLSSKYDVFEQRAAYGLEDYLRDMEEFERRVPQPPVPNRKKRGQILVIAQPQIRATAEEVGAKSIAMGC